MGRKRDDTVAEVIKQLTGRIHRLQRETQAAVGNAKLLAKRGQIDQAVKALMDFEGPARDSLDLFRATLTIRREFRSAPKRLPRRED